MEKARESLQFCEICKQVGADYKIPEEWFYSLYYCALAILCKFGVETRSQRCIGLFIQYIKEKCLIDYDNKFIEMIMVHKEKEKITAVDEREEARYGPQIKMKEVQDKYDETIKLCKEAIFQAEGIVYSDKKFEVPKELL